MDLWRCAIVRKPAADVARDGFTGDEAVWLPDMPGRTFHADPFGLWRGGMLHVFAEAFDYRTHVGHIDVLVYDAGLALVHRQPVLREPWHLSYPFVFEAGGETWLLPEGYKSGTLTLYRARRFPLDWEAACTIPLDGPAIDATPLFHAGRWWLFYTPSHDRAARRSHLHIAWAEQPTGPWHLHPGNPVRVDVAGARPGGTPWVEGSEVVLPVQDCRGTYGAAVRLLRISTLDEARFAATGHDGVSAPPSAAPFTDGLHTLSAAGDVALVDVKRMDRSLGAKAARIGGIVRRRLDEALGRTRALSP